MPASALASKLRVWHTLSRSFKHAPIRSSTLRMSLTLCLGRKAPRLVRALLSTPSPVSDTTRERSMSGRARATMVSASASLRKPRHTDARGAHEITRTPPPPPVAHPSPTSLLLGPREARAPRTAPVTDSSLRSMSGRARATNACSAAARGSSVPLRPAAMTPMWNAAVAIAAMKSTYATDTRTPPYSRAAARAMPRVPPACPARCPSQSSGAPTPAPASASARTRSRSPTRCPTRPRGAPRASSALWHPSPIPPPRTPGHPPAGTQRCARALAPSSLSVRRLRGERSLRTALRSLWAVRVWGSKVGRMERSRPVVLKKR